MQRFLILLIILGLIAAAVYFTYTEIEEPDEPGYLTLYGNVDVRQVDLGFRVGGRVDKLLFQEGDLVPAGKLVATLDKQPYADQVLQAQASAETIRLSLLNAEQNLKRRQELVGDGSVSKEDYDNALSARNVYASNLKEAEAALGVAKTNLRDTEVYAPNEGIILTRIREPGTIVRESDPVYTLSLTNPVWIRAFVSEPELGLIYPNMPAEIYTDTPGSKVYQGHIGFISPVAEFTPKAVESTQLRTDLVYRLRVITDNPDNGLRQGMPVTVRLTLPNKKTAEPPTPKTE